MSDLVAIITTRLSEGRRISDEDVGKLLARIAELEAALKRIEGTDPDEGTPWFHGRPRPSGRKRQ